LSHKVENVLVKEVDTARDDFGKNGLGLLDKVENLRGLRVDHDTSVLVHDVRLDFETKDGGHGVLIDVEFEHLGEGEGGSNVSVQDKEFVGVATEDFVTEVVQATTGSESLVFAKVADF
jgi:hypothetical protein